MGLRRYDFLVVVWPFEVLLPYRYAAPRIQSPEVTTCKGQPNRPPKPKALKPKNPRLELEQLGIPFNELTRRLPENGMISVWGAGLVYGVEGLGFEVRCVEGRRVVGLASCERERERGRSLFCYTRVARGRV